MSQRNKIIRRSIRFTGQDLAMSIVIVDTPICNLKSLSQAIRLVSNNKLEVLRDPRKIADADHIVLPGGGDLAVEWK